MVKYRVGIGYDIHRLVEDRALVLGGVTIPYEKGLLGHSDADVLIHSIIDAILGAASMPDIGTLFPDTDEKFKDVDSKELLKEVVSCISKKGYRIENIDSNIIAQSPKMMPYIDSMKKTLSDILNISVEDISIKAKTKEKLDSVGEKLAIETNAVVLLSKDE